MILFILNVNFPNYSYPDLNSGEQNSGEQNSGLRCQKDIDNQEIPTVRDPGYTLQEWGEKLGEQHSG